jgi:hypothetical protein
MAITIWMLAGASYLDLIFGFSISRSTLYREFDNVIQWINQTFLFSKAQGHFQWFCRVFWWCFQWNYWCTRWNCNPN